MKNEIDHIIDNIAAINIAMLTTIGEDGQMHSRPMYTLQVDNKKRLWFYTNKGTVKTRDIHEHQQVNLAYADMHTHTYISLSGRAYEIDDDQRKRDLWDPTLSAWFPEGPDDENVRLLVVEMEDAAFWDSAKSVMKTGIRFTGVDNKRS